MTSNLVRFISAIVIQSYVDETMDKKNLNYKTKPTAMVANFEESFCGVIAELLTK